MGNNTSSDLAWEEANKVKDAIARKCDCYVVSIEHTNSVVDVKLNGLRREISDLVDPLRKLVCFHELGLLGMSAVLEDVENFANEHKFLIKRMLDIMFDTQNEFEEMSQRHLNEESIESAVDDDMLDENCVAEMRAAIESIVKSYESELNSLGIPLYFQVKRCDELRRLLFKLAESTVSESVEFFVLELKDSAMEEIDNDLCLGMLSGQFSAMEKVKDALKEIVTKSVIARASLEALPFSRRMDIEAAQDEIAQHVDQLVRRIQMNHVHSPQDLLEVMNIDLYDDSSGSNSESDSDSADDAEDSDDDDEDEEAMVTIEVPVKVKKSPATTTRVTTSRKSRATGRQQQPAEELDSDSEESSSSEDEEESEVLNASTKRGTKRKTTASSVKASSAAPASSAKKARPTPKKKAAPRAAAAKKTKATSPTTGRGKRQPKPKQLD